MTKTPGRLSSRIALVALALAAVLPGRLAAAQGCQGDILANGIVNGADLGAMLSYWGPRTADPFSVASDIDGNGTVDGADLGALLASWGYCPAVISSVSPSQGCLLGGTEITISGTWLGSVASVTVGGIPCSGVTVDSAISVRATVPAGASGAADVAVTTIAGTTVSVAAFTYRDMMVSAIIPSVGLPSGGTPLSITGECLGSVTAVSIGASPASAVTVVSSSTVTANAPSGPAGTVDVVLMGSKGSVTINGGFSYRATVVPSWATLVEAQPDPSVVTDPSLRAAIAGSGFAWRVRDSATQIEMLLVPPGTFLMGCSAGSPSYPCTSEELPVHQVALTRAFYLGRYEVTQAQWIARMGSNPSSFTSASPQVPASQVSSRPVDRVSWTLAQQFLSRTAMRLPSEAEWEFAYRAGTTTAFHGFVGSESGTNDESSAVLLGWTTQNALDQTRPVGRKRANGLGFFDMVGNVSEWVGDWYAPFSGEPQSDPQGPPSGTARIPRGGSWNFGPQLSRASARFPWGNIDVAQVTIGLRVARDP
jgi:formylglycine-generating enzyme required for sulfatase activity